MSKPDSPIYDSYGDFRESGDFKMLFQGEDYFKKNQEKAAKQIVDHILLHCDGTQGYPKITSIVDFGCGDGSLLNKIKTALNREIRKTNKRNEEGKKEPWNVKFIGVDPCPKMIELANHPPITFTPIRKGNIKLMRYWKKRPLADIEFTVINEGDLLNGIPISDDWQSTAFLCLGHTWFHILDQKTLLDQIKEKRPALLLVDVFQSWDDKVAELADLLAMSTNPEKIESKITLDGPPLKLLDVFVEEEIRAPNDGSFQIYALRTQLVQANAGEEQHVVRGIYKKPVHKNDVGRWLFATRQVAKLTEKLRPKPGKQTHTKKDSIDTLREIANLGEITGEDKCNYIVLREFEHVSGWGNMHCIAFAALSVEGRALNEAYFQAMNGLVNNLFVSESNANTPSIAGLRAIINIFGRGEVAVILPFDPLCTFARMVPLLKEQKTAKKGGGDAELDLPPISTVDLIMERPNWWQQRFPTGYGLFHAMLDLVSSPVGFPLSRVQGYEESSVDKAYEELETQHLNASLKKGNDRSSYFIIPFYSGSLPLFSLILEEPSDLPASATNGQLYFSLAQNIDRQLQVVIGETLIRGSVIAPFLIGAWRQVKELKRDTKSDDSIILNDIQTRFGNAMETKPWKSWVRALPSHNLTSLDGTASENDKLKKIAKNECARIEKDAITQISFWFQTQKYFANTDTAKGHEFFICKHHTDRLKKLLITAPLPLCDSAYFSVDRKSQKDINVLNFASELVTAMLCGTDNCDSKKARCNTYSQKDLAFIAAKRLFCRDRANEGTVFRFSFARLFVIVFAASKRQWNGDTKNMFEKFLILEECVTNSVKVTAGNLKLDNCNVVYHDDNDLDIGTRIATRIAFLNDTCTVTKITDEKLSISPPNIADHSNTIISMALTIHTDHEQHPLGGAELGFAAGSEKLDFKKEHLLTVNAALNSSDKNVTITWSLN